MPLFPFTAIVEQHRLKKALLLNAVNPAVGGVLIQGPSGTAKSTAVRGLAELLPEIAVSEGCPFSGDPLADSLAEARTLRRRGIVTIAADTSDQTAKLGDCGVELAEATGGQWLPFDELVYPSIEAAWREADHE